MVHPAASGLKPAMSMKSHLSILGPAVVLLSGMALAELPRKVPHTAYSELWTNSPFTSKPPPPEAAPETNPLEDYALGGVSPVADGYRVTLLNRKNPEERIIVESSRPDADHGFKIASVNRKPGNPLATTVILNKGSVTGSVEFEESLLTLKAPPAAPPQNPPGVNNPGRDPRQPGQAGGQRQPRPRVVPPTTSGRANPQAPGVQPNRGPQPQTNQGSEGRGPQRAFQERSDRRRR
jgi:hypothetical protein